VFKGANKYGGPGKFAFNSLAYMDENHPLASSENGQKIIREWARFGDFNRNYFIEKSPPNLIRFRFFQKIWPDIRAVMIFRHPLAVSYATQKWCSTDIIFLLDHTLTAYEIFMQDKPYLKNIIEIKYEDFVKSPQEEIDKVYDYLSIPSCRITHNIRSDVNKKYYDMWESNIDILSSIPLMKKGIPSSLELRANKFGYSLRHLLTHKSEIRL